MKLSFSLPSKTSSKPNPVKPSKNFGDDDKNNLDAENSKKFVTEFNASETITDSGKQKDAVILPIQNEWRPQKRMKNLELPMVQSDGSGGLHFEVESPSSAAAEGNDSMMSYGLNLRKTAKGDETEGQDKANGSESQPLGTELSWSAPAGDVLLQKLKYDLRRLPEDQGMEEFTDRAVEGYGAALLAGYGWYEGRGIGKNTKEDVKVVEYHKRTDKQGLGFVSDDVPNRDANTTLKSNNKGKEKNKEREGGRGTDRDRESGTFVGKEVRIVEGRDAGLKGRIVEKLGHDRFVLRLSRSEELVKVQAGDVAELGSKEEERCLKRLKELKIQERGFKRLEESDAQDEVEKKASKSVTEQGRKDSKSLDSRSENQSSTGKIPWLTSHIRVRIISKDLKGGRLYLKKGKVVDVVTPRICDISMDESKELVRGVSQDLLETALPRRGGPVLVLSGKHKGVYGSLVERDLDRETGVVRDADNHALLNVHLEQIAEYIGDPSYLGY
ncbi:Splicing factor, SPF [Trema orientale]|uniref:Splicing factor, SPF n=1 Tax=Trema orientale TaxID=63057 RepID=A0A2P5EDE3_TREOI|nr:Splicing factor, SPF [Trema orientale]